MVEEERKGKEEEEAEEEEVDAAAALAAVEEDEDDDAFVPGKQVALKEQLEMDKDDESLRKWKEQLLGNLSISEDKTEPELIFKTMRLLVEGRDPLDLPVPSVAEKGKQTDIHFVLKEKSQYRLQFEFHVRNELLLGLTYQNKVYRMGAPVDKSKLMLGTYGPQEEPYTFVTDEETTPHGMLARGKYTAKTSFTDDDGRTHLEFEYCFEIRKEW